MLLSLEISFYLYFLGNEKIFDSFCWDLIISLFFLVLLKKYQKISYLKPSKLLVLSLTLEKSVKNAE